MNDRYAKNQLIYLDCKNFELDEGEGKMRRP